MGRQVSPGPLALSGSRSRPSGRRRPAHFVQYTHRYTRAHQTVAWPIRRCSRLTTGSPHRCAMPRRASRSWPCSGASRRRARRACGSRWSTVPASRARSHRSKRAPRAAATRPRSAARCRSSAFRSRSRTTSTSPASPRPRRARRFATSPPPHAHAVERLIAAGAVCVGKTNLDQFATGLVGTRSPYGRPSSVFAAERISGGSSSGSAVVVARGDVPFALGTDTAGSGRIPAGVQQHRRPEADAGARQHARRRAGVPQHRLRLDPRPHRRRRGARARPRRRQRRRRRRTATSRPGRRTAAPRCASASRRRRSSTATPATARPTSAPSRRCASSATRSCRSTSRRSMRSPSSSTRDRGSPSDTPSSRPCSIASPRRSSRPCAPSSPPRAR